MVLVYFNGPNFRFTIDISLVGFSIKILTLSLTQIGLDYLCARLALRCHLLTTVNTFKKVSRAQSYAARASDHLRCHFSTDGWSWGGYLWGSLMRPIGSRSTASSRRSFFPLLGLLLHICIFIDGVRIWLLRGRAGWLSTWRPWRWCPSLTSWSSFCCQRLH